MNPSLRVSVSLIFFAFAIIAMTGQNAVVADSASRMTLPSASVFDSRGNILGISNAKGIMPFIPSSAYPITIRFLGYKEKVVDSPVADTVFMCEISTELPEVTVETSAQKAMHMLAYVREYSTLSTYTDTVMLFREKMVDYMLVPDKRVKFKGWTSPRILKSKSYYHFTDASGLDSVSDASNHHFSWADWIGLVPDTPLPAALRDVEAGSDTLRGKYSVSEVWTRNHYKMTVDVNVLADTSARRWVPNLSGFFKKDLDFEYFKLRFNYDNVLGDNLSPADLTGCSFNIESNGRGHNMFRFNRVDEPFFVSTYAEVYIIDKEYITIKEARKWERRDFNPDDIEIIEPLEAPELQPSIQALVDRVSKVDKDKTRLAQIPDYDIPEKFFYNRNYKIGRRALFLLRQLTGITLYKSHKNLNRRLKESRESSRKKNQRKSSL